MLSASELIKSLPDFVGSDGRTEEQIAACEQALGLVFAADYREYLKEIGLACFDGRELTGISSTERLDVVAATKEARTQRIDLPASFYVVEDPGIDGILIWQDTSGTIYETGVGNEVKKICDSLEEYLQRTL